MIWLIVGFKDCRFLDLTRDTGTTHRVEGLPWGLSKGSQPVFTRVLEKTTENTERLGRQARPGFEPSTSHLPVLSATTPLLVGLRCGYITMRHLHFFFSSICHGKPHTLFRLLLLFLALKSNSFSWTWTFMEECNFKA